MADYFEMKVDGLADLQRNLAEFGTERIVGRIIKTAMQAGARVVRPHGASNARSLGLGAIQFVKRDRKDGGSYRVYGRIPRALKVGRAYKPRGFPDLYRVNVVARGQRQPGIYRNRAPHAHLIEYGFNHNRHGKGGPHIPGRPFLGPALNTTAPQVTERIAQIMAREIDRVRFKT